MALAYFGTGLIDGSKGFKGEAFGEKKRLFSLFWQNKQMGKRRQLFQKKTNDRSFYVSQSVIFDIQHSTEFYG
jgi:hypothetical protein